MSDQKKTPEQVLNEQGINAPIDTVGKVEILKLNSKGLRGTVRDEITDENLVAVCEDNAILLKHHGMYQQDNRDTRIERKRAGLDKDFSFMIRAKIPAGKITAEQFLIIDDIATASGSGSIRLTTRQTVQFHGVGKGNLQTVIRDLNKRLLNTYGACGDVVRNVMSCPVADLDPNPKFRGRDVFEELSKQISDRTLPRTGAYYDIFIDGEKQEGAPTYTRNLRDEKEDLYGDRYMPRKFKIGATIPQDNCVDIFSQDLGIVAILDDEGNLTGYNILAGGGMGSSHGNKETYPRVADPVCFVPSDDILRAVDAVIVIQRDYGNRVNRKRARLKYVLDELGPVWFREEMCRRIGYELAPPVDIPASAWGFDDHLGMHPQREPGLFWVGAFIENGRIIDKPGAPVKSTIRKIVEKYRPQIRLTGQQNILFANLLEKHALEVMKMLQDVDISTGNGKLSTLRRNEIACVSLPTCGLALAEAERAMPTLMERLEAAGYGDERIMIRMSGCPNSCSRAPMSEIGLIGRAPGKYNLYIGGDYEGTRLNQLFKESVAFDDVPNEIGTLIDRWRKEKQNDEAFGDFCHRLGVDAFKA